MIDVALIVSRFLHYAAATTLAGVAFFPLYAYAGLEPEPASRWRSKVLLWSSLLALLSGAGWFAFVVANMSDGLEDLADTDVLASVVGHTGFGAVWTARMIVSVALVAITFRRTSSAFWSGRDLSTSFFAALLLASLAGTGHSQIEEGWQGALHVVADAAHLLAAGAWLGGLVALGSLLSGSSDEHSGPHADEVGGVLLRFSGMGYAAVATLVATGLVNSWLLVGSISGLLHTGYGRLLIAKLVLFCGMLGLAAANRYWLIPALETSRTAGPTVRDGCLKRLWHHVAGEQALGLLVLLCVAVLGTIRPAIEQ